MRKKGDICDIFNNKDKQQNCKMKITIAVHSPEDVPLVLFSLSTLSMNFEFLLVNGRAGHKVLERRQHFSHLFF